MPLTPKDDPSRPATPSNAGITRNSDGQQIIPASLRPDGTTRREIKVRPGYRPPEDVEVYTNRTVETWKNRGSGGVPGAAAASDDDKKTDSAGSDKNAKRRAARKRAKELERETKNEAGEETKAPTKETKEPKEALETGGAKVSKKSPHASTNTSSRAASPKPKPELTQEEKEKLAKGIRKKIRQANELKVRKDNGENLLPEQLEKVIKLHELARQLNALGLE
ncbi:uncharacterized protein H6S33_006074 [Morchella sextelata]|jgi:partner of Y14 and mago protein|uniref:uncharacterized protein n=1 Tax=Morchella sextelata TaxID=1174677 RepID=UPI001D04CE27|nr:uncharacterized protein H6S33_006074 [Morchella sextelata]KAH0614188.1 hypothetical protein H6S33_006074 [Morchella sextelata]